MGKRANTQSGAAAKKAKAEPKADPAFTSVSDALMDTEQIPQRTRTMLVEMLPFSLKFASDERHELQSMAVDMVEQSLVAKKSALEASVASEDGALSALKASESQLGTTVKESEAALAEQKDVSDARAVVLANAMEAENASKTSLTALRDGQKDAEDKFAVMKEEKEAINAAFGEHFKHLQEGEAKAHFKKLEPFLKKIEIESTLLTALPSTCAKKKEARGTFDNIVLQELENAFNAKIKALVAAIEAEGPASAQREAAVQAAEQDYSAKQAAREKAASECEAAQKEQAAREAALAKAKQAVEDFLPQLEATTGRLTDAKATLAGFEAGPFANFQSLKNRIAAVPEEPPAEEAVAAEEAPATEEAAPPVEAA